MTSWWQSTLAVFAWGDGIAVPHEVVVESDRITQGVDFGNHELTEIRGTKWHDLNGDGTHEAGEPGLAGVIIYADLDENGERDTGEPFDVTDGSGEYSLTDLVTGTYRVSEVVPDSWRQTFPSSNGVHVVLLQAGEVATGKDFGNIQIHGIRGTKWLDIQADGIRQAGEPGLEGWTIYLDLDDDGPTAFYAGGTPRCLAVTDFDLDGDMDLLVSTYSSGVELLRNVGDGSFTIESVVAGMGPIWVAPGDIDGDEDTDLAVANELQRTVETYSDNGDGTFARTPLSLPNGEDPSFVALEDLDDDGDLDLVAIFTSSQYRVWTLLNDGLGHFGSEAYYFVGSESESLAAADFATASSCFQAPGLPNRSR